MLEDLGCFDKLIEKRKQFYILYILMKKIYFGIG